MTVARSVLMFLGAATVLVLASPALAQGGPAAPPAPRLDEQFSTRTTPLEARMHGMPGVTCQMLQVDAGEAFYVTSVSPGHVVTLEAINGAMCNFADDRDLPEGWRLTATAPEPGRTAMLTVTVPGYYSVRAHAPDLPPGTPLYIMTVARKDQPAE